jgi:hypothetical protein
MRGSCTCEGSAVEAFESGRTNDRGNAKRLFGVALGILALGWFVAPIAAGAQDAPAEKDSGENPAVPQVQPVASPKYFVEFRARPDVYDHVYVTYGTLNERGVPGKFRIAGLYPEGGQAGFALGHIVPVPASLDGTPDDRKLPTLASYRRELSEESYKRLIAEIRVLHKRPHTWHAMTYNCVTFASLIAKSIGLKAPQEAVLPVPFVKSLRELNGR